MLENKLITGLDIDLTTYNLGYIKQPTIRQLVELPFEESEIINVFGLIEQYYKKIQDLDDITDDVSKLDTLIPLQQITLMKNSEEYEEDKKNK